MKYLLDKQPRRFGGPYRERRFGATHFALFILIVLGIIIGARHAFSSSLMGIATPIWKLEDALVSWITPTTAIWASNIELKKENETLREELQKAQLELESERNITEEYSTITALFGASPEGRLVRVLSRPPQSPFDTVVIGAGAEEGVDVDDLLYAPGNIAVGTVLETYPHTAKALLFSAPGQELDAFIEDTGPITLKGEGGGNFIGEFPRDIYVPEGTEISFIQNADVIALTGTTTQKEGESFQEIRARVPINIQEIRWIEIRHQKE